MFGTRKLVIWTCIGNLWIRALCMGNGQLINSHSILFYLFIFVVIINLERFKSITLIQKMENFKLAAHVLPYTVY